MSPSTVVVFAGGDSPPGSVLEGIPEGAYVIAADSGFDHAMRLGVKVDLLVGDLDSISAEGLGLAGEIEQHPTDKNATDLAIALAAAARRKPSQVIVVGGAGGRIDHFLANAALLTASEYADLELTWLPGDAVIHVVRDRIELSGSPGDVVTLLPYGGPARGVSTGGLRWPLTDAVLARGTSLGVSNQMIDTRATVELSDGILLVVQPHGP
ncbi:MAG: thiamine diphosphokinase [Acidimicrobiia bacterium]